MLVPFSINWVKNYIFKSLLELGIIHAGDLQCWPNEQEQCRKTASLRLISPEFSVNDEDTKSKIKKRSNPYYEWAGKSCVLAEHRDLLGNMRNGLVWVITSAKLWCQNSLQFNGDLSRNCYLWFPNKIWGMLQSQMIRKAILNEMTQWQCQSTNKFVNNLRLNSQFLHFKAGPPGICRGKHWLATWN